MSRALVAVAAFALAACAGPVWTKAGVDPDTARADYAECQSQARDATRRDTNIDADILASRGYDWASSGTLRVHQAVMSAATSGRQDDALQQCMIGKGYSPRS